MVWQCSSTLFFTEVSTLLTVKSEIFLMPAIYGRDFDEDAMKIEDIIGEMGEVVIRGKIANFDKRDIRNEKTIL